MKKILCKIILKEPVFLKRAKKEFNNMEIVIKEKNGYIQKRKNEEIARLWVRKKESCYSNNLILYLVIRFY